MIDLGVGQPDPELLPLAAMRTATAHRISQPDPLPWLAYGVEQGNGFFREALAQFLSQEYERPVAANDLFVTNGASQGLSMICSLFTRPGDTVLVEDPTYFLALRVFADHQLEVVGVPMDRDGMQVDALEERLVRHRPVLVYTIPSFHNPTSATLSAARRERLVELALRHGCTIVADEVYQLLHYTVTPPPPLAVWADTDAVLSLGSFSKILAPGLRLGWIQAGAGRLERLVHNGLLDSGGGLGPFTSSMVESAIELGLQGEHLLRLRRAYEERATALCDALREYLPPSVDFDVPGGGFFVWLRLPEGLDAHELLPIARRHDVGFQPGRSFSCTQGSRACARLCFAYYDREQLVAGVRRLARALEELRG
jgi:DNA-binding transcriptional MocR family regulator